ncbi:MAG TPA: fatty acid desaturase [Candidatus Solibacter sp.]|nr:fatty acid desaturase [Candidatus Solibacter sp.]
MTIPWRKVNPLRFSADLRTLLFLFLFNALLVVQWRNVWRSPFLLVATYTLAVVALVAKHNHMHLPIFRNRAWNSAFGLWLSALTAHPCTGIITSHNELHHGQNNTDADFVRSSLVHYRSNLANLAAFFFASVATMYRNKPADLEIWRCSKLQLYRQAIAERCLTYSVLAVLLIINYRSTLKYCIGPWFFGQWVLVTINLLQHQACDAASRFNHSRNITGRIANWLLLNNGYHTVHHMFPTAHWSKLPVIHERVVAPHLQPGLSERSLWLCVWRRFILGRNKDWQGAGT